MGVRSAAIVRFHTISLHALSLCEFARTFKSICNISVVYGMPLSTVPANHGE